MGVAGEARHPADTACRPAPVAVMATFFRSFWTSSMPKRLLRYALSRLEMLDDETLDLENLELALGRDTVLEFHDVGIILQVGRCCLVQALHAPLAPDD